MSERAWRVLLGAEWIALGLAIAFLFYELTRLAAYWPDFWTKGLGSLLLLLPALALFFAPWLCLARGIDYLEGKR